MSLDAIAQEIERGAKAKSEEILEEANKEKARILNQAKAQLKEITNQAIAQAQEFGSNYEKEKLSSAELEAQRIIREAKDEAVEENLKKLWDEFVKFSSDSRYPKFLKRLVATAIEELGTNSVILFCNEKDKKILSSLGLKIGPSIQTAGGVRVESKDSKIISDYTFESIFEQKKQQLKLKLNSLLFEQDQIFVQTHQKKPQKKPKSKKRG
jgi:vacuolar-type H+-ATPase subunit E/Vma4